MRVSRGCRSRLELDNHLDDLASGNAQVVPLEIDAPGSHLLRLTHVERQAGRGGSALLTARIRVVCM